MSIFQLSEALLNTSYFLKSWHHGEKKNGLSEKGTQQVHKLEAAFRGAVRTTSSIIFQHGNKPVLLICCIESLHVTITSTSVSTNLHSANDPIGSSLE